MYNVQVRIITDKKRWLVILSEESTLLGLCTLSYYKSVNLLCIDTFESTRKVKGLSRIALIKVLKITIEYLKYPKIFLYSRSKEKFYLPFTSTSIHPDKLKKYWMSILEEIEYKVEPVGYKEVRSNDKIKLIASHVSSLKKTGLLKDDPISRVLKHNPLLTPEEVSAILSNSKDLTNGNILFAHPKPIQIQSSPPPSNALLFISSDEFSMLIKEVSESNKEYLAKYPFTTIKIDDKETKRQNTNVKVTYLKRTQPSSS